MKRRFVVALLITALSVNGCAHQQSGHLPALDSDERMETIAMKGRGEGPIDSMDSSPLPEYSFMGKCLEWTIIGGTVCLLLPVYVLLALAKSHGSTPAP